MLRFMKPTSPVSPKGILLSFFRAWRRKNVPSEGSGTWVSDIVTKTETRNEIRRKDREKDDAWVGAYLQRAAFGFLATVRDGQPFLNSNLFVYDADRHAIYLPYGP